MWQTHKKFAALSPHILDSMLALGVQPVAYAEVINLNIQTYDNPTEQIPYIGKWVMTQPVGYWAIANLLPSNV